MWSSRAYHAKVLHAAGGTADAKRLFADAEERYRKSQPNNHLLYSVPGYHYCDLLLSIGESSAVSERASRTLEIMKRNDRPLDVALDTLIMVRAHMGRLLKNVTRV